MPTRLVTIATFDQAAQARLAQNALQEAGIDAAVSDEALVAMDWLLSNAVGGVKVQVREEDADRAVTVLENTLGSGPTEPIDPAEFADEAAAAEPEDAVPPPLAESGDASFEIPRPSERDDYARRMVFTAILGYFIGPLGLVDSRLGFLTSVPIAFYSFFLLLNAVFGNGNLSSRGRFNLFVGVLLLVPYLAMVWVFLTLVMAAT